MRCRLAFLVLLAALCATAQIGSSARAAEGFALTLALEGTGTGTVECEVNEGPAEPCAAQYPEGTELILVPSPGTGSEFTEFTGDCGPDECELTMSEDKSVTATFELTATQYPLTLKLLGTGSGTVECQAGLGPFEPCKASYPEGTELTLAAQPDANSEFERFSGDCTDEACDLTMDEPHDVNVFFVLIPPIPEYAFTLILKGTGSGSVLCEAQEGPEPCQAEYPEGTELLLHPSADSNSVFAGFSGGGCKGLSCEVIMEAPRSVSATFNLIPPEFEYLLAVEHLGTGAGTVTSSPAGIDCGSDCSESFFEGTKVTLTATPAPGSAFDHWTGGGCTGSGACTATMSTNRTVKAVFTAVGQRTLTVSRAGMGKGAVTSSPAGIDCRSTCAAGFEVGTRVTLTATAATGSRFAGFSGACAGATSCKVTMDEARDVTATFEKAPDGAARAAARAKVKAGKALLRISCVGEGACKGKLKLLARVGSGGKRVTIGTASFSLAPDASRTLRIGLTRKAKQALSHSGKGLAARVAGTGIEARRVRLEVA